MEMIRSLILSLGSNLGDREDNILKAYALIEKSIGPIIQKSALIENEAVGFESESLFLNSCIEVETSLPPLDILLKTQEVETKVGRKKKTKNAGYESRLIDIDIILLDDLVYSDENLTIPHKLYRKRSFVLFPLLEIAKDRIDPIIQLAVNQLSKLVQDN